MEKKKNSKIKEYWNAKGKNLALRILHIVCYVLSLGFIILCVYACANTNNKDNKQENVKKGLYLEHPRQLTIDVNRGLMLSTIDEEWFNNFLMDSVNDYIQSENVNLLDIRNLHVFEFVNYSNNQLYNDVKYTIQHVFDFSDDSHSLVRLFIFFDGTHYLNQFEFSTYSSGGLLYLDSFVRYVESYWNFDSFISLLNNDNYYLYHNYITNESYDEIYAYYLSYEPSGVFDGVSDGMSDYIDTIGEGLESSVEIFYDEDNSQLTAIGWLSVIVVAVGLTWSAFSIISGLIRLRG